MDESDHHNLHIVGVSCHSAPVAVCEGYYLDETALIEWGDLLKPHCKASEEGFFVLSTCDRTEIFYLASPESSLHDQIAPLFRSNEGYDSAHESYLYHKHAEDALLHWLRITSALDSRMVGETQIVGQIKDQFALFEAIQLIPPAMIRLQQFIHAESSHIRNETQLGQGIVSLTNAALAIARDIFGTLGDCRGLIIGLGEAAEAIATRLEQADMPRLALTGPSRRTKRIAALRDRRFFPFERHTHFLDQDVIISAHGTGEILLTEPDLIQALKQRNQRPILLFDGGEPNDFDPTLKRLDEIFYYPTAELYEQTERAMQARQAIAQQAEAMAEQAVADYCQSQLPPEVIDTITGLKSVFEQMRQEVLATKKGANPNDITRLLSNRLLHLPIDALKKVQAKEQQQLITALKQLYNLQLKK